MTESNNVKFVEAEGKWLWKRYDENGSVIYRSPLFNTEREAREDYDINGGKKNDVEEVHQEAKDNQVENTLDRGISGDTTIDNPQVENDIPDRSITGDTTINPPEDENTAGTATLDDGQERQNEDNGVGQATI